MFAQQAGRRRAVVAGASFTEFRTTGAGNFTVPAGYASLEIKIVGPGAGGARSTTPYAAYGGGGGARLTGTITLSGDAGKTLAYVCGSPGAGRSGSNGDGFNATNSTLDIDTLTNGTGVWTATAATGGKVGSAGAGGTGTGTGASVTNGSVGFSTLGGASGDGASGGNPYFSDSADGSEYGGGGGPGFRDPESGTQYSGGSGAVGIIQLTWVP